MHREVTISEIEAWVAKVQEQVVDPHYAQNYPRQGSKLEVMAGRRYARIVKNPMFDGEVTGVGCRVYCFIDKTTGNIHKPASWKAPLPAKRSGVRGNILAPNNTACVTEHGVAYLAR